MSRKNTARKKRNVRLRLDNKNQAKETLYKIAIWWECVDCTCHPDPDPEQEDQFFAQPIKTPRQVGKWYESSITRKRPLQITEIDQKCFFEISVPIHWSCILARTCCRCVITSETKHRRAAFIGEKFKLPFEEKFEGTNIHLNPKNTASWPVRIARRVELVLSERNPHRAAFVPLKLHPA